MVLIVATSTVPHLLLPSPRHVQVTPTYVPNGSEGFLTLSHSSCRFFFTSSTSCSVTKDLKMGTAIYIILRVDLQSSSRTDSVPELGKRSSGKLLLFRISKCTSYCEYHFQLGNWKLDLEGEILKEPLENPCKAKLNYFSQCMAFHLIFPFVII